MTLDFVQSRRRQQRRSRRKDIANRAYDVGAKIFLGIAVLMASFAVVILFRAPQISANIDRQIADEIAKENQTFCEKRGLIEGTHDFIVCELDLNEIRANDERRIGRYADF